jgi:hypothetical protein
MKYTVKQLIEKLEKENLLDWEVHGTGKGSLYVVSPDEKKFGYVQINEKKTQICNNRMIK